MDVSQIDLKYTESWAILPHVDPAFDLASWADQEAGQIAERYAAEGERADVKRISRDLRVLAKDSATREPLGAFALYLSGLDTSVAVAEVDAILPDHTASEVTPQWMIDHLVSHDFGPPQIDQITLPLGPAVRIRQNVIGEKRRLFGSRPVIRTLAFGVQPEGEKGLITLICSWTDPVLDGPLGDILDDMAQTLTL
ncbi:hypothetical protein ACFWMQ_04055 [Streptomyces sp. NPDC058372]|uniref:hypothetical protein n=1 Tax=Streptomyces sp. NPDC058372 TaxID=3346464 RepID=UPI003669B252